MATKLIGFLPFSFPGSSLGPAGRQYTSRISPGEYNNTIEPFVQVTAGDKIVRAGFACRATVPGTAGSLSMAAYVTNSVGETEGSRVGLPWQITTDNGAQNYYETALDIDLSAFVGQYIKPAGGYSLSGLSRHYVTCATGDSASVDNSTPASYGVAAGRTNLMAMWIEIANDLAPSITSVNSGEPIIPGVRSNWETINFAPTPNATMLDGVACVDVDADGFTPPSYMDSAKNPRPGNRTLTATNGTQSANATVPVGVIAGYKYVQLVTVGSGSGFIANGMNVQPGWFITYPDAHGNNVTDSGMFQTNLAGTQVFWAQNGDTGESVSYNVITGPGGEIIEVSRSLTAKSLTMSGLTMRSLTARGL